MFLKVASNIVSTVFKKNKSKNEPTLDKFIAPSAVKPEKCLVDISNIFCLQLFLHIVSSRGLKFILIQYIIFRPQCHQNEIIAKYQRSAVVCVRIQKNLAPKIYPIPN